MVLINYSHQGDIQMAKGNKIPTKPVPQDPEDDEDEDLELEDDAEVEDEDLDEEDDTEASDSDEEEDAEEAEAQDAAEAEAEVSDPTPTAPSGPTQHKTGTSMRTAREAVRTGMRKGSPFILVNDKGITATVTFEGTETAPTNFNVTFSDDPSAPVGFADRKAFYKDLKPRWSLEA